MSAGTMDLAHLLNVYQDGDENGWDAEFAFLQAEHSIRIGQLYADVAVRGIREPIQLGPDGRVWDGHHRLCVAALLKLDTVPVEFIQKGGR